jgi:hypothetical protein
MKSGKIWTIGAATIVAGLMLVGAGMGGSGTTYAGGSQVPPCDSTNTPVPSNTPTITPTATIDVPEFGVIYTSFGEEQTIPTCTVTPEPRTHTPTNTGTPASTSTPVPTSPTPVPPTNTPTGGGGGEVSPPNTGSGPQGAQPLWWVVAGGIALAAAGVATLGFGFRRR